MAGLDEVKVNVDVFDVFAVDVADRNFGWRGMRCSGSWIGDDTAHSWFG